MILFVSGETYKVEVKEPPQGVTPPTQSLKRQQRKQVFISFCTLVVLTTKPGILI